MFHPAHRELAAGASQRQRNDEWTGEGGAKGIFACSGRRHSPVTMGRAHVGAPLSGRLFAVNLGGTAEAVLLNAFVPKQEDLRRQERFFVPFAPKKKNHMP